MRSVEGSFLSGPVEQAAPALLGWVLHAGSVSVRITEVEAYGGEDDAGSHAHRGPTPRNASMFGGAGRLYCYLSYGIHVCANVVTGSSGTGSAVLLRAGVVLGGEAEARSRRGDVARRALARGPACLTRALGVRLDHDGTDLLDDTSPVRLVPGPAPSRVGCGPRVGLTGEPDRAWRWWCEGDATVSAYRRSPRAHPPI